MHNHSEVTGPEWVGREAGDSREETLVMLVARARAGEESAWAALYRRFTPMLRGLALGSRLGEHEAGDVVQQTWLKAFEHIGALREPQALPGWLATTCRREILLAHRQRGRCVPVDVAGGVDGARRAIPEEMGTDPTTCVEERELVRSVRRALTVLPDRQARLLRGMLSLDGAHGAYGELADRLSMPIGSIGPTRLRAFQRLRREPLLQGL